MCLCLLNLQRVAGFEKRRATASFIEWARSADELRVVHCADWCSIIQISLRAAVQSQDAHCFAPQAAFMRALARCRSGCALLVIINERRRRQRRRRANDAACVQSGADAHRGCAVKPF